MKFLIPIVIVALIILGAVAFWKFGMGGNNPLPQLTTQNPSSNISKQAPVTGNPDDIGATINQAAQAEGNAITSNDESPVVNQNNSNAAAVGDSYNESSF